MLKLIVIGKAARTNYGQRETTHVQTLTEKVISLHISLIVNPKTV